MEKESQNIEWKETWRDEYLKWICGFANAQGGKIYLGINDKGIVTGVTDAKKLLEDIPNKISNFLGIIADVNLYTEDGKDYIEIVVSPNSYPVSYKGEYHYRTGSTKQQLTGAALNQFLLKKTGIIWDNVPIDNVTVADFRSDSFDIFKEQAVRSRRMNKQEIVHKNYATLIPIQISVYKDKIYIGNECVFPEGWTVDNLLGKHNSRPYNPLIANTFFRAGYIESWGRGIQKIKESCEENGNEMAEYKVSSSEIMVVFHSLDSTTNQDTDQANQGTDQVNAVEYKILNVIGINSNLSQRQIAEEIDEKLSTVKYYMTQMKKQGKIERVGSSQKGHWMIRK